MKNYIAFILVVLGLVYSVIGLGDSWNVFPGPSPRLLFGIILVFFGSLLYTMEK